MKLAALFNEQNMLVHLQATSYEQAVRLLVETLGDSLGSLSPDKICERVLQIETSLPIPPGHGVRIPHLRLAGIESLYLAIATSEEGILLEPDSDERIHLIFLILAPKAQSSAMLQTMASIARLVHTQENRKALISTTSAARLLRILEESGIEIKKAIIAADLMTPAYHHVLPEMTLRQSVEKLAASNEEGIPVLNAAGDLQGELTVRIVIELSLPKYMNLISNPKVLSDFQPFEAFYRREDTTSAEEIMQREVLRVAPETPVEIVAHEMLTKHSQRAYVVKDDKLIGVVYRKDIIRKVLSF